MTTLKPDANEQMREKAEKIVDEWDEWLQSAVNTDHTELHRKVLEAKIVDALTEAHADGRQEILDRLPSDEEMHDWIHNWTMAAHAPRALDMFVWLKSRLTGEST